eukprot:TRINITY_DN12067_c0_g1_i1.p2 TRINITY_DN12067_c0_g1~~TRINITY_DN12067_c0_g1_i1.p2  ORF type:complete len:199 (+),score=37.53 TRINITY_DN12067_c0_g1_i1:184-780(+)
MQLNEVSEFTTPPRSIRLATMIAMAPLVLGGIGALVLPDVSMQNAGIVAGLQLTYGALASTWVAGVHGGLGVSAYKRCDWPALEQQPMEASTDGAEGGKGPGAEGRRPSSGDQRLRAVLAVLPPLVTWGSMGLSAAVGSGVLLATLTLQFLGDHVAHRRGLVPGWFMRVRTPFTLAVLLGLGATYLQVNGLVWEWGGV